MREYSGGEERSHRRGGWGVDQQVSRRSRGLCVFEAVSHALGIECDKGVLAFVASSDRVDPGAARAHRATFP